MALSREEMAARAAKELSDGYYVNLGIGPADAGPQLCPRRRRDRPPVRERHPRRRRLSPSEEDVDPDLINAGKETVTRCPARALPRLPTASGMIRGGKVDAAILGAIQVSVRFGDIANWTIPGKMIQGGHGRRDGPGARRQKVIVLMEHVIRTAHTRSCRVHAAPDRPARRQAHHPATPGRHGLSPTTAWSCADSARCHRAGQRGHQADFTVDLRPAPTH